MKKIFVVLAILIAIGVSLTAVSADDEWSFNFSSAENSDGGSIDFENGVLKMQGIELTIPDGYKMDEDSKKLAEDATDADAKFSACKFVNGDDEIVVNVFFADTDFESLSPQNDTQINKTISNINGLYEANRYDDDTPTFTYLEDGKIVQINAPNDEILKSIISSTDD